MNCRDCIRFEAHATNARRAGRCTLNGDRAAPAGTCAQFADAFDGFIAGLLDRLDAEGCAPHLIPGAAGPRLAVRLSADSRLNLRVARHHARLTALLIARCQPAADPHNRAMETPLPRARRRQ